MKLKVLIMSLILGFISVNANSQTAEDWFRQGVTAFEGKDYQKAIECWQKVIKYQPDDAQAYYNMGLAYAYWDEQYEMAIKYYEKAIKYYEKVIKNKPDLVYTYDNMAYAYERWEGQYEKAIECYERIIKLETDNAYAYYKMGDAYLELGNKDKAIANFKKAAQLGYLTAEWWLEENGIDY